jgi:hypothetical protein
VTVLPLAPAATAPAAPRPPRPIGYFVHHQGRGHAERCAALLHALPEGRPATVFCADPSVLPPLPRRARVVPIPSLFERRGDEAPGLDAVPEPDTVHCAPLGWPAIAEAMGALADWFRAARPALIVADVSAEVAQLARLFSVPHVKVLQHGARTDPGHRAAYRGAAGLLAPFHEALAQPGWDAEMRAKTHFAAGLGAPARVPARQAAREALGIGRDEEVILVMSGAGGGGLRSAPLGVGARALPRARWLAIGRGAEDWHATLPGNVDRRDWVEDAVSCIAAADVVVSTAGNTTCAEVLAVGRPWVVLPEWCYFDEQLHKARALARAGAALHLPGPPASAAAWRRALARARARHDPGRQRALVRPDAAARAAGWLDALAGSLWAAADARRPEGAPIPFAGE